MFLTLIKHSQRIKQFLTIFYRIILYIKKTITFILFISLILLFCGSFSINQTESKLHFCLYWRKTKIYIKYKVNHNIWYILRSSHDYELQISHSILGGHHLQWAKQIKLISSHFILCYICQLHRPSKNLGRSSKFV